jgi:formate/nitrite transporter
MSDYYDSSTDSLTPSQMASRVETIGVAKAQLRAYQLIALGLMAGVFISFGAMNFTTVMAQGLPRIVASLSFCLGLILVIIGGAEMFTGNNMMAMAWAERKISTYSILRNWGWVYFANLIGCLGAVALAYFSGALHSVDMQFGVQALKIAAAKTNLGWGEAFFKGILCNSLVCLAVWLCLSARSVTDRILAIIFPISAFVNMGFEHCVANMFFIPMGLLAMNDPTILQVANLSPEAMANLTMVGFAKNLSAVTLGNIVGGTVLVAGTYYAVYLRGQKKVTDGLIKSAFFANRRDADRQ